MIFYSHAQHRFFFYVLQANFLEFVSIGRKGGLYPLDARKRGLRLFPSPGTFWRSYAALGPGLQDKQAMKNREVLQTLNLWFEAEALRVQW